MTTTPGRRPTLGEVLAYYTQEAFLRYLLATLRRRRVALVITTRKHWEPDWGKDGIEVGTLVGLEQLIRNRVSTGLPGVDGDTRPDYYPAFHQMVTPLHDGTGNRHTGTDCVFESDVPTWRDAFQDVGAIAALLDAYGVPYQHKFSGHRSLHMTIPGSALPSGYRGKGATKLARVLLTWSGSHAHALNKITRMPYSLNEDTGLVALPIAPRTLDRFRPWHANLHVVDVPEAPREPEAREADRERLARLIEDLRAVPAGTAVQGVDPANTVLVSVPSCGTAGLDGTLAVDGPAAPAWRLLAGDAPLREGILRQGLTHPDADVRWLTAEAYLCRGAGLSRRAFDALLAEEDEYARVAATDVLLHFEESIRPYVLDAISDLTSASGASTRAAYLLTQSPPLRDAVFATLITDQRASHETRISVACLAGALTGNWAQATTLLTPVEDALRSRELPPETRAHLRRKLQAIEFISTLGGWDKREEAKKAHRLARLGPQITPLLLVAAASTAPLFRRGVVTALADLADPRATEHLIRALDDDYTEVRRKAIAGLIHIGVPAVDALLEAAGSDQLRPRRYAVHCLGSICAAHPEIGPRVRPAIIEALYDGEEVVRTQAIRALKAIATPDDLGRLSAFLREAEPDNAVRATEVLEGLGEAGAQAMARMAREEANPAAAYFLAEHGDAQGRELLAAQLGVPGKTGDDAVAFLRMLRDPRCVPYLAAQLRNTSDWEAMFIAHELGEIGGDAAVAALIEALKRDAHLVRRGAARGLALVHAPAAIPALIEALGDPDGKTRAAAVDALAAIGDPAAVAIREALAQAPAHDGRVRGLLHRVLIRLEQDTQG